MQEIQNTIFLSVRLIVQVQASLLRETLKIFLFMFLHVLRKDIGSNTHVIDDSFQKFKLNEFSSKQCSNKHFKKIEKLHKKDV